MLSDMEFIMWYHKAKPEIQAAVTEILETDKTEPLTPDKLKRILTKHGVAQDTITEVVTAYSKERVTA